MSIFSAEIPMPVSIILKSTENRILVQKQSFAAIVTTVPWRGEFMAFETRLVKI